MKLYCLVKDCKYRSNRKSRIYTTGDGKPLYVCKKDIIVITNQYDPDGESLFDNKTICSGFEPINEFDKE